MGHCGLNDQIQSQGYYQAADDGAPKAVKWVLHFLVSIGGVLRETAVAILKQFNPINNAGNGRRGALTLIVDNGICPTGRKSYRNSIAGHQGVARPNRPTGRVSCNCVPAGQGGGRIQHGEGSRQVVKFFLSSALRVRARLLEAAAFSGERCLRKRNVRAVRQY